MDSILFFVDPDECIDFLTDAAQEKTSLVIPTSLVQRIVPLIHDIPQIYTIYIFSNVNEPNDEEWTKNYNKIKETFTETESICVKLQQDIQQSNQDAIPISFLSLSNQSSNIHLDQLDSSFMYSQLLKEILLELEYNEESIKEFVNYCREQFADNHAWLHIINTFEMDYRDRQPIWWYTKESFIYDMLNRALRTFDIGIMVKMGFFIRDLHEHINQLHAEQYMKHKSETFTVYRGQGLSTADFEQMKRSQGGLISFNSFLSTSRDRGVSLKFAVRSRSHSDLIGILFKMVIDPSVSSIPFAAIREVSYVQKEDEILFSMHTVFRIREIKPVENRLYEVDLTLTADNDQELQILTEHIRREITGHTGFERLGALMLEIGHYDMALKLYETLLNTTHRNKDKQRISSIYNQLGAVYIQKGDFDQALDHYYRSLEIKLTYVSPTDSSLSTIYSNIGSALRNQNQLDEALKYMDRALETERNASESDQLKIASYRNNIGLVLTDQNKYTEALIHYEKALGIQQTYLPSNHPNLATSYNNIGIIYNEIREYSQALSCYEKALEIMQRSLPSNHPNLATPYNNVGSVYSERQEYSKALVYYTKSMEIMKNSLPPNHPSLALGYHNLALTYYRLQFYEEALSYVEKAVEICRHALEPSDSQMIACQETLSAIRKKLETDRFQQ